MKRLLYLLTLSMAALLFSVPVASAQDNMTVSIQDFFFDPGQLTVAPGTTVTWVNKGQAPHTVTSTDGKELNSATLQPGDTYSFTFGEDDAGEHYAYHCSIHPQMTASVTVSGSGGGGGGHEMTSTSSASSTASSTASSSASSTASSTSSPTATSSASTSPSASTSASSMLPDTGGVSLALLAGGALLGIGALTLIAMRRTS